MKILQEELWIMPKAPGMIVVTTNGAMNGKGELVMGRGAARQAKDNIPGIARECGTKIWTEYGKNPALYHFMVIRSPFRQDKIGFGLFQVKMVWVDDASTEIIYRSAQALAKWANANPTVNIRMNFPGIGNGRLARNIVEPLLFGLPDNVVICFKEKHLEGMEYLSY
jgi:hypothetical protein